MPDSSPLPPAFTLRAFNAGDHERIVVTGEVDLATAPQMTAALARAATRERAVVLDLGGVTFMDSTGVGVLLEAVNNAKLDGWDLSVAAGYGDRLQRLFRLTGVEALLPVLEE